MNVPCRTCDWFAAFGRSVASNTSFSPTPLYVQSISPRRLSLRFYLLDNSREHYSRLNKWINHASLSPALVETELNKRQEIRSRDFVDGNMARGTTSRFIVDQYTIQFTFSDTVETLARCHRDNMSTLFLTLSLQSSLVRSFCQANMSGAISDVRSAKIFHSLRPGPSLTNLAVCSILLSNKVTPRM